MKRLFTTAISVFLSLYASLLLAAQYSAVDLGTLGGDISGVSKINNNGQIVGISENSNDELRGYVWENGVMTDIGLETDIYYSSINGISDSGVITGGRKLVSSNKEVAFVKTGDTITDIDGLSGSSAWTWTYGINSSNQITGYEITPTERLALVYDNGTITYITNTLGGQRAEGRGINDLGHVTGFAFDSANSHDTKRAFFYDGTTMHILGTLGGLYSTGYGINNKDEIVGEALNADGQARAFYYTNSQMLDLGTLGGNSSTAFAINEESQIVGWSKFDDSDILHAFIYQNGQMYDLNDLLDTSSMGITLTRANDINELGQIVVIGYYNSDPTIQRAFLLNPVVTPIPEPMTIILLSIGMIKLLIRKR